MPHNAEMGSNIHMKGKWTWQVLGAHGTPKR